jgi:sporulation protein YlmC with PRC-barrel domain
VNTNASHHSSAARFRVSQLLSCRITNAREENLGDVKDIVLANDDTTIAYVVVKFGGFLGMGSKYFAMPWRLIHATRNSSEKKPRITLAVDQDMLKAAPGFDKTDWPDMADMSWARQVDEFYRTRVRASEGAPMSNEPIGAFASSRSGRGQTRDASRKQLHSRRVSEMIGMDVVDARNEGIAKVDDLVLDAERSQIEGAALRFGGVIGIGTHLALVPIDSLTPQWTKGEMAHSFSCTTADLQAMALPGGEWPGLDGNEWLARGRKQCGLERSAAAEQSSTANFGA